jgi:hypothetical protein
MTTIITMLHRNTGIKIYNKLLFDDEPTVMEPPTLIQHGRSKQLIANRDTYLLYRFYYKSRVQRMVFYDCLKDLSDEVFISKMQIQKILLAKGDDILMIKKEAPTVKFLKEKYPHVIWN